MQNRASIRARLVRLEDSAGDDLSDCTTPAERLALVADLTREAWALSSRELPGYSRGQIPVVKVRLDEKK